MGTTTDSLVTPSISPAVEPALVVAFGSTSNKRRVLNKASTLIGRNRCCDIRVESPEISGLHCLVSRHSSGLTLRDCDSKSGVIVNGQVARECELKDGDQIQLGPFSFVVSIPAGAFGSELPALSGGVKEELERKESQEKCLQNHIASVEAERDRIASQLQDMRAELHRSMGKVQELDEAYSEIDRLRTEISDREKLSAELGDALCSLDQYRKSAEIRNGRMADELEALRATIVDRDSLMNTPVDSTRTDHMQEWQNLRTEVDRLQEAVQEYRQQIDQLTQANEALQQSSTTEVERLRLESDRFRREVGEYQAELARLSEENDGLRTAAVELAGETEGQEDGDEARQLRLEIDRLAGEVNQAHSQVEQLTRENQALQALAKDYQTRAEWIEEELEKISSDRQKSRAELEALRFATDVATKESTDLREQSRQLESELATLRTEHVTLTQTQAHDLGGSRKRIEALQGELAQVRDELASREKQLISAQQEKAQLRAEIESAGTGLVGELAQARAHIADLERELTTIRNQGSASAESDLERDAIRQQIASLERQVSESQAEKHRLIKEIENLSGHNTSSLSVDSSELGELAELRANWQASEESRLELARRLEAEHEQNEQRLLAMRQQLESERNQMKQLVMQAAAEHDRTRAEMESLRSQLASGSSGEYMPSFGVGGDELDYLRARVQELENALVEGGGTTGGTTDLEQYEQQLEQYRADLEQAQAELGQREQELETERQNVQEKLRQTELELSRERAAFAREKAELDRMRREFLSEVEHAERESNARAKLAPLDRLASEVKGRAKEGGAIVQQTPTFSDRLRNLIKRASDNPSKPDQSA